MSYLGDPGEDTPALYTYQYDYNSTSIPSQRDLEDWGRLWICGVPALAVNQGYSVTLSMSAQTGSPAINLVDAIETNGGMLYLTDTNTAVAQTFDGSGHRYKYPTISPTTPLTLPANLFTNTGNKYFLFEGSGTGACQVTMTISQGLIVLAQTSMYLDLHNIKDFYEQAVITDNMSGAISNWTSAIETVLPAKYALGNDTNLIVLVHGINVQPWDCVNDAETVLKRLYWAGYQGSFAEMKWPCNLLTPIPEPLTPPVFNLSELQANKASTAFITYLTQLRARFPGFRLHLLVHSQGNSLVSEALAQSQFPVDTYILTQGAVSDGAYDVNATDDIDLTDKDLLNHTPDWQPWGYRGIYTNLTARMINFYNPADGVLAIWVEDQISLKPSVYFDGSAYYYDGTASHYNPDPGDGYIVTDPQESRSMVARSRSLSVGQSGPAGPSGVIQRTVDLSAQFGFFDSVGEHSAQWTRPIQTSLLYYRQIVLRIQPTL